MEEKAEEEYNQELNLKANLQNLIKASKKLVQISQQYSEELVNFSTEIQIVKEFFETESNSKLSSLFEVSANLFSSLASHQTQNSNKIYEIFNDSLAHFVEFNYQELEEYKKKNSSKFKKNRSLTNLKSPEIGRKRSTDINQNDSNKKMYGEIVLRELKEKRKTKILQVMKNLLQSQAEMVEKSSKVIIQVKPKIEEIEKELSTLSTDKITKEGYLYLKTGDLVGSWQKSWFVLKEGVLHREEEKGKKETQFDKPINVLLCSVRIPLIRRLSAPTPSDPTPSSPSSSGEYKFELVSPEYKKPLIFKAESEDERKEWVNALQSAISSQINQLENTKKEAPSSPSQTHGKSNQEYLSKIINFLRNIDGNKVCADCGAPDPEWAVINYGILVCVNCCGVHRSLGSHISKVRSLQLDKWDSETVLLMRYLGNKMVNSVLEEILTSPKPNPESERSERELFIKTKYVQKNFIKNSTNTPTQIDMELIDATIQKNFDPVKMLRVLAQGANIDFQSDEQKNKTPLMLAVFADNLIALEFLLQNGANTLLRDDRGWCALHYCAQLERPYCADAILKFNQQSKKLEDSDGMTPLRIAESNSREEMQVLLGPTPDHFESLTLQDVIAETPILTWFRKKIQVALQYSEQIRADLSLSAPPNLEKIGDQLKKLYSVSKYLATRANNTSQTRAIVERIRGLLNQALELKREYANNKSRELFLRELTNLEAVLKILDK